MKRKKRKIELENMNTSSFGISSMNESKANHESIISGFRDSIARTFMHQRNLCFIETIFHKPINPFAQKYLQHHYCHTNPQNLLHFSPFYSSDRDPQTLSLSLPQKLLTINIFSKKEKVKKTQVLNLA